MASKVIDNLDVHVARGAVKDQTRGLRGATEGFTDTEVAACACFATSRRNVLADWSALRVFSVCHCLLTRLSDLATDLLAFVANTFALVRIVLTQATDISSDLSD